MIDEAVTIYEEAATIFEEAPTILESAAATAPRGAGLVSFRGCQVLKEFAARGGESDIFLLDKGGERLILKLYRLGMEPSEEVLRQISSLGARFPQHVVAIREFGYDEETRRWYELQEYAALGSLRDLIDAGSQRSLALSALRELSAALKVLHQHNVLHLDLKPANILVRSAEPLDLIFTDFGVSSVIDPELSRKLTTVKGTPHYWAPESITGVVGKEADLWALGMIVQEILLGAHPFAGIDNKVIMYTLATKGVEIPAGVEPEFIPLLQGLLTREPHLRWGMEQVERWLGGERGIPVYYEHRSEKREGISATPYQFQGKEFSSATALAGFVAGTPAAWKAVADHVDGGQLEQWLSGCGDFEGSVLVAKLREGLKDNRELAVLRFVYGFDTRLPFALYGRQITPNNLRIWARRFLKRESDEFEEAIVDDLVKGNLLRYYREYLLLTRKEPDLLAVLLETAARMATINDYVYQFEEELLRMALLFDAVGDPQEYLLWPGWTDHIERHMKSVADHACYLVGRQRYAELNEEFYLPEELTGAIDLGSREEDLLSLLRQLKRLGEGLEKKAFYSRREVAELRRDYLLPAGALAAVTGKKLDKAVRGGTLLRSMLAAGDIIPRRGAADFLEKNASVLRYVLDGDRLATAGQKADIPLEDYRRLARYMKNNVQVFLLPKLEQIMERFVAAAEMDPQLSHAPLYLYTRSLRSLQVPWDPADKTIIREMWEQLSAGTSPQELLGQVAGNEPDRWTRWLELFLRREVDTRTREREWGWKGAVAGAPVGMAVWFLLTYGAVGEDLAEGAFFKILIGMLVISGLYRQPAVQAGIVATSFGLWYLGGAQILGAVLYLAIGANLMGALGCGLGRTKPCRTTSGENLCQRNRARLNDVARQLEGKTDGR